MLSGQRDGQEGTAERSARVEAQTVPARGQARYPRAAIDAGRGGVSGGAADRELGQGSKSGLHLMFSVEDMGPGEGL